MPQQPPQPGEWFNRNPAASNSRPLLDAALAREGVSGAKTFELLFRRLGPLPTLPAVSARLGTMLSGHAELAFDVQAQRRELIELVGSDPSLTARLLCLAAETHRTAESVAEAFEVLPWNRLLGELLTPSFFSDPPGLPVPEEQQQRLESFWLHCVAVGCGASRVAEAIGLETDREAVYTCGLLHDLGKIALEHAFPKGYRRVLAAAELHGGDVLEAERSLLGVDHAVFGRRFGEWLCLPAAVVEVAWLHHQSQESIPPMACDPRLVGAVGLADSLVRREGLGSSANQQYLRTPEEQARSLGLPTNFVEELAEGIRSDLPRRAVSCRLDHVVRRATIFQTYADSAAALGRANESALRRSAALEDRCRGFDSLSRFFLSLRADTPMGAALALIAEMIASALNRPARRERPYLAYSAVTHYEPLNCVCINGEGEPSCRTAHTARRINPRTTPPRRGPAAQTLQPLLRDTACLSDWLDLAEYMHFPLHCDGRWLGGVLIPAGSPQAEEALDGELLRSLLSAASTAVEMLSQRDRAKVLGEELAGASRALAAAQEAFAESRTLSAVGEMAAGAAHEMNNPLAVISGRAQLMSERASTESDRRTWKLIAEQAQQVSDIVSDLMDYASPPVAQIAPVEPKTLLESARREFFSSNHPQARAARVDITIGEELPAVLADRQQIVEALLELIRNAVQAAGETASIRLSARDDPMHAGVQLCVSDFGTGMDPQTLAGAFTPFFSAQQAGRRRGLGLPRAKRYVENNRGRIWIRSRRKVGTTVHVLLPYSEADDEAAENEHANDRQENRPHPGRR